MGLLVRCLAFLLAAAAPAAAHAQGGWPAKPVRIVVAYPPGGGIDVMSRQIAEKLTAAWSQPVVVENRPGANTIVATDAVAKSGADGYTVLMTTDATFSINPHLYAKLPFDTQKDFIPVTMLVLLQQLLVANASLSFNNLDELIKAAKARPGSINYASYGSGSQPHLSGEMLKYKAGIDLVHVPYKGTVPAIASVLSGDTALAFGTIPGVVPHAKAGKLVLLGASFGKRFSQIQEVPAIAETIPGYDMGFYTALFAPAKTPKEIVDKLHQEVVKAHAQPKVKEIFANSAAEPGTMTPAELKQYLAAEVKAWGDVVRSVGLKID